MGLKTRTDPPALFTRETVQFLIDLEQNNNREWFHDNKLRYETCVRAPANEFIRQMRPHLAALSKHFEASDKRVGGSLLRIYRDTRFAADKTPYKTHVGVHFRHRGGKDVHAPGLYVHLGLDQCFLGVGTWRPERASLAAIRKRIIDSPREWHAARDDARFRETFELSGESLSRMPRGYSDTEPDAVDLRRKDHTAICAVSAEDVLSRDFVDFCADRFLAATPYLRFLTKAVGASF